MDTIVDGGTGPVPFDAPLLEADQERYEVQEELGRGGVGTVLLCVDRQIGRPIALKVLRDPGSDPREGMARFVREARIQGQLEHPSVVPVHDLATHDELGVYFTMQRVRGVTLATLLRRLQGGDQDSAVHWSRRRLLEAFGRVCLAVDYAHERGILHRDLKPANIMFGEYGEVYVLDWGLAGRDPSAEESERPKGFDDEMTRPGVVFGTPGYMPPEQVHGFHDKLSPASDVYALGAILFELLTLTPLHAGDTPEARYASTIGRLDARPSSRAPGAYVPPELEAIVVRAVDRHAEERFPSARALQRAIERYLDGEQEEEQRRKLARRHAEAAHDALEELRTDPDDRPVREEILRELGRALALDPTNQAALGALVEVMSTPPRTVPQEVRERHQRELDDRLRKVARAAMGAYASMFVYLPFMIWAGIREPWPIVWLYVGVGVAFVASLMCTRARERPQRYAMVAMLFSNLGIAATASIFGPLFLTPAVLGSNTAAYALHLDGVKRWIAVGSAVVLLLGTTLLFFAGGIPGGYAVEGGALVIASGSVQLVSSVYALLLVLGMGVVLTGSIVTSQTRDQLVKAELSLHVQRWQLAALAPTRV